MGQFQYPGRVYAVPGGLLGTDFLKSIWFSEDGSVRREVDYTLFPNFAPNQEMVLLPASSNFVRITSDHDLMTRSVTLVDGAYQAVKVLDTGPYLWNKPGTQAPAVAPRLEVHCEADEIYVANSARGFVITVYDTDGTQRRTINLNQELEPVPFTADHWEVFSAGFQAQFPGLPAEQIEAMFTAPEHFPAFHQVTISDGRIYVTTYRERDGLHEMLVLDTEGNLLDRMYLDLPSFSIARRILRFDLFDIDRDQLFELLKNAETEIWELYVTDLD